MTSSLFESYLSLFLLCAQHPPLVCYCRADAVKDEQSVVNHEFEEQRFLLLFLYQ